MNDPVPFVDLRAQYADIKPEVDGAIAAVLEDCAFIQGPYVEAFEHAFAARLGARHAIGCSSGTSALTLALEAFGVRAGDEVITVAHTFFATVEAILGLGAQPVFVDVDPRTHSMDPAAVAKAVTPRTRAIVPVHIYGAPCAMDAILDLAQRHRLKVIEDAAQAHLATWRGKPAGTLGDAGCFSFFPGKNLGAYGDAGAVVTADDDAAARMRSMRNHGRVAKYEHDLVGYNHRMDGVQGAVLSVKLRHLDRWTAARRRLAALYDALLADAPVRPVAPPPETEPAYHLYVVELDGRDQVRRALKADGIETGVHYPLPCHLQPALGGRPGALPVTEALAGRVLSLPMYPELPPEAVERVAAALRRAAL